MFLLTTISFIDVYRLYDKQWGFRILPIECLYKSLGVVVASGLLHVKIAFRTLHYLLGPVFYLCGRMSSFLDLLSQLENTTPVLVQSGRVASDRMKENIRDERAADGSAFDPIDSITAARKGSMSILKDAGDLESDIGFFVGIDRVDVGPSQRSGAYNSILAYGGTAGQGAKLPARNFVGESPDRTSIYGSILVLHLRGVQLGI